MAVADLFDSVPDDNYREALRAELESVRAANPDDLVFRINRWAGPIGDGRPDITAVMVVKPGKREGRPQYLSMLLGIMAAFGADEMDVGKPAGSARQTNQGV